VPAELGLGPLPWLWGLWCAAALLLASGLPWSPRLAAAALAMHVLRAACRSCGGYRSPARLWPPAARDSNWRLATVDGAQPLPLVSAGRLPGYGWLLRFGARAGPAWVWVPARGLDRRSARRLRAAITAGRT